MIILSASGMKTPQRTHLTMRSGAFKFGGVPAFEFVGRAVGVFELLASLRPLGGFFVKPLNRNQAMAAVISAKMILPTNTSKKRDCVC